MYEKNDQFEASIETYKKSLALDSKNLVAVENLAYLTHYKTKNLQEAMTYYDLFLLEKPDDYRTLASRGQLKHQLENPEGALEDLNSALQLNPAYAWAYAIRGVVYKNLRKFYQALEDYDRAVELQPEVEWVIAARGLTYYLNGDLKKAEKDFIHALSINKEYGWGWGVRAAMAFYQKQFDLAFSYVSQSILYSPEDDFNFYIRSLIHKKRKNNQSFQADLVQAIQNLETRLVQFPWEWRGRLYLQYYRFLLDEDLTIDEIFSAILKENPPKYRIVELVEDELLPSLKIFPHNKRMKSALDWFRNYLNSPFLQ
jgi:tetratricopeptide (TPR) repeat protein